ncbi:metal ABC transporter permease [Rhodobacteraceae bacterium]|nr:metal ABC transporter permease [Paracoccaceae bacterium]MDC1254667.1 metal ABC transporter permease [Paracoccaceae bacterium]
MLDSFLIRAALAGIGIALAAGPLGCFIVWRRMAYFGEATAHASVLGIALSLAISAPIFYGALLVSLAMAVIVSSLSSRGYAMDTLLGVVAHSALASGLVAVSFISGIRIDIMAFLFGDILAVNKQDLLLIWFGSLVVMALIYWRWSPLLIATMSADLAHASGIKPKKEQLILTIILALFVAVAIKVIGVILIVSMLVIPAATALRLTNTPEKMAIGAMIVGTVSVLGGLQLSFSFDTPTGPTIVCFAAILFIISNIFALIHRS